MKSNKIEHGNRAFVIAMVVIFVAIGVGLIFCYGKLRDIYLERCVIRDMSSQVMITSGKMVLPSTIADEMGLRPGKNLATIDFAAEREQVLAKIPNLRTMKISRKLPDKVYIVAEERTPFAKMGIKGQRKVSGRVVDTEGMVFLCQRGTQTLPTIDEPMAPGTQPGQRIKGRTLAALRLIEACREPEFLELGILAVDTTKHDFLIVTLGNYSRVKILWKEMDESTPSARADLLERLTLLRNAIRTRVATDTVIWNATIPGKIFADTQGKF